MTLNNVTISIIIAILGLALSVATYSAGQKKTNTAEVAKRAEFEGEVKAKLDLVLTRLDKFEENVNSVTADLHDEIARQIQEHERRYHKT